MDWTPAHSSTLPCGCVVSTNAAHWVVDIQRCARHQTEWDAAIDTYVARIDQEIEDAVFARPSVKGQR